MLEQGGRSVWKMGDTLFNILLLNNKMMLFTGNKENVTNIYLVANLNLVEKWDQQLLRNEIPASF